jgi:pimeloyl-ACP methyl ester carboxylesterase
MRPRPISKRCTPLAVCTCTLLVWGVDGGLAADGGGYQREVKVSAPTRIDWVFAVANQSPSETPAGWLEGYKSTAQSYELYVPPRRPEPSGLVLFISPTQRGAGLDSFRRTCDQQGLIFASPHKAGNPTEPRQRIRIVLDVLDDVRRKYRVDPDRTYIAGFSGGGRIACAIGFALPEHFGGVLTICAAGELRREPWLRHRVIDRLSVAHLTGENDFNRGEVERYRDPILTAVGVRSKAAVVPKLGHAIPPPAVIDEAVRWLDDGLDARRKLAQSYPATRAAVESPPTREAQAGQLLAEGKDRLNDKKTLYSGLMLLKGVLQRWPDLAAADEAKAILLRQESATDRSWEEEDRAQQRRFLIAGARGLSDYAAGPLPQPYAAQREKMARSAIQLWEQVIQDGQDRPAVAEAEKRLLELKKLAAAP